MKDERYSYDEVRHESIPVDRDYTNKFFNGIQVFTYSNPKLQALKKQRMELMVEFTELVMKDQHCVSLERRIKAISEEIDTLIAKEII